MKKVGWVIVVWIGVIISYVILTAAMPAVNSLVQTANTTMAAASNMTNYPGTQDAILTAPLWLYFLPGGIGLVLTIIILKSA